MVGGISRTVERDGWRFDIGGHRFFTKVEPVERLWHEILPDEDFLLRPRMSRIFYEGKYYDYPLKAMNALKNLGPWEAFLCGCSYLRARISPPKDQTNYEGWLVARFGWRLYRTFFKTYTEKVWGVPVSEMPADWAAQRVKNLDLSKAILNAIAPKRNQKDITSLIEEFQYPKYGPGMMWERCRDLVEAGGGVVLMGTSLSAIHVEDGRATAVTVVHPDGRSERLEASHVISSTPMAALATMIEPSAPEEVLQAGRDLHYRDFLTVALVVPEEKGFPDNWIYIHAKEVAVGRIQNFGSWSPYMVKEGRTCLGLEYFVFEGDELWSSPDEDLVARATRELGLLGLVDPGDVEAGYVVRDPQGLPPLRLHVPAERRDDRQVPRRACAQRPPGRAQRHAQVQQPGPFDVHRHAHGREHPRRPARHLGGERRRGVPRAGSHAGLGHVGHRPGRPDPAASRRALRAGVATTSPT